jgi:two-component system phosphate regulon sensor histidine kinase PhoR
MFRRLLACFFLPLAALGLGLCVAVWAFVEDLQVRRQLLQVVAISSLVCAVVVALLCAWGNGQLKRSLGELMRAVERIGIGDARVFLAANDDLGTLGKTFNRTSERLSAHIGQLEADRQQLRAILSGMVEGVVALDSEQRILFANDRAAQLLDFSGQSVVGRPLWAVVRQRSLIDVIRRALGTPEAQREEIHWIGNTAGPSPNLTRSLTVHAARLSGGKPHHSGGGAVLVLHDTTELRRLERLRQDFVANVSHELKTPLSVIKVCVETLQDGAAEDPRHRDHFLGQIARQSDRLHMLILDLLSLARIESGDELFDFQAVPVVPLVHGLVERFRPRAEARGQVLEVASERKGPPVDSSTEILTTDQNAGATVALQDEEISVWADEEAVEQILENLLDNALKYTPEKGRVSIHWHVQAAQVCIEVSDTGIGIPPADLPRIFERFYRVDKARSREMGGTGLGLSIVKHLAQAMHGSVQAVSRFGQGSTFQVWLPYSRG